MSESTLLFYHGLLAMAVLTFYVLFLLFCLSTSAIPFSIQRAYRRCPRALAHCYVLSAILVCILQAYLLGEYGLYYMFGQDDVEGMVRFRHYLTLSEGAGLTSEVMIGALGGALFGGLLYWAVDYNLVRGYRPINLFRTSLSPSETILKEWVTTELITCLTYDMTTLAQREGFSIRIDLATGSVRPEGSGRLRSPARLLKSLTPLKRDGLTCLQGEVLINSSAKYHPISISIDATFMGCGRRLRIKEQCQLTVEERFDHAF